ncbi:predicted transmembrane transcriptional regulator (anti-sigma factor) [Candidatus Vecturithrix granuli]|uniref:Predicted transmembrane transcriptional regulator (Anti-sigma factor) n=1 Tax=Vecturithrix granuli TaxID=1499967 RepID=A0A081CA01_VECG1|nr:predicted transmembrane transcriptional regulator (anti-sigma factor) [Candidatus Vecturithrix granuli]
MNCEASRILISGYLDGELSEQEARLLKVHLQACESCVSYLQRQEALKNALKHYALFQDHLEAPSDFAKKVVIKLQETLTPEQPPLAARIKQTYRHFVFGFVDSWVNSLKTRPFAWATIVSCMLVLVVGLVSFKVVQQVSWQEQARMANIGIEPPSPIPAPSVLPTAHRESVGLQNAPSAENVVFEGQKMFQVAEVTPETRNTANKQEKMSDFSSSLQEKTIEFVETNGLIVEEDESPFIRVASHHAPSVEDYVYSHVVEVYQTHLVDDAVFVGYVHGVFTQ